MSVSTGRAVVALTELDPERFEPVFVTEGRRLDPQTGESVDDDPLAPRRQFTDLDAWNRALDELRATLLTPNI
jgi:hypothetical protein